MTQVLLETCGSHWQPLPKSPILLFSMPSTGQSIPWDPDVLSAAAATFPFLSHSLPYFLLASGNAWTLEGSPRVHPLSQATPLGAAVASACSAEEGPWRSQAGPCNPIWSYRCPCGILSPLNRKYFKKRRKQHEVPLDCTTISSLPKPG